MKKYIIAFILIFCVMSELSSKEIQIVKWDDISAMVKNDSDTTYVINFWATWCKPCINELHFFEEANENYKDKPVKIILVSLDFKSNMNQSLVPFLEERKIKSDVVLRDDLDYDSWISKAHPDWEGAIPATLLINNKKGVNNIYTGELKSGELTTIINSTLN